MIQLIFCLLQLQIGGVPRVLEQFGRILTKRYPEGPYNDNGVFRTNFQLDRKGILDDLVFFIRKMWNLSSMGSQSRPFLVCLSCTTAA